MKGAHAEKRPTRTPHAASHPCPVQQPGASSYFLFNPAVETVETNLPFHAISYYNVPVIERVSLSALVLHPAKMPKKAAGENTKKAAGNAKVNTHPALKISQAAIRDQPTDKRLL